MLMTTFEQHYEIAETNAIYVDSGSYELRSRYRLSGLDSGTVVGSIYAVRKEVIPAERWRAIIAWHSLNLRDTFVTREIAGEGETKFDAVKALLLQLAHEISDE